MNELKSTIIILAALVVFLTGCEKDIDFNSQYESGIAIYSLVMPGEPFTLRVSHSTTRLSFTLTTRSTTAKLIPSIVLRS